MGTGASVPAALRAEIDELKEKEQVTKVSLPYVSCGGGYMYLVRPIPRMFPRPL
jgi:hypothetical protein